MNGKMNKLKGTCVYYLYIPRLEFYAILRLMLINKKKKERKKERKKVVRKKHNK